MITATFYSGRREEGGRRRGGKVARTGKNEGKPHLRKRENDMQIIDEILEISKPEGFTRKISLRN